MMKHHFEENELSPDQINAQHSDPVYRCRVCRAATGLHWFNGTSCPVCDKPSCNAALAQEYTDSVAADMDAISHAHAIVWNG